MGDMGILPLSTMADTITRRTSDPIARVISLDRASITGIIRELIFMQSGVRIRATSIIIIFIIMLIDRTVIPEFSWVLPSVAAKSRTPCARFRDVFSRDRAHCPTPGRSIPPERPRTLTPGRLSLRDTGGRPINPFHNASFCG
jgi:hypothetical protein